MDTREAFRRLFVRLRDDDLFKEGPRINIQLGNKDEVRQFIKDAAPRLPGLYQDAYVAPLVRNLESVLQRDPAMVETLAGAVYDHGPPTQKEITRALNGFVAVISNIYRSFLEPEPMTKTKVPLPQTLIPPLATFRPQLDVQNRDFGPFTLPVDLVNLLCGGTVGVVSLPSNYRNHPVLCWGTVAHETGGHDVLRAYGLVREIQQGVRKLFYLGPDPPTETPESRDQFLGLLWQYWTEETASDVCAVMNLGPAYGVNLPVYFAALNERIHRLRTGRKGKAPHLSVSWPPPRSGVKYVDPHPTDILKLNVLIGVIESLPLSDPKCKQRYISQIKTCIEMSLETDEERRIDNKEVEISGYIRFKPGRWIRVKRDKKFAIERTLMEEYARQVGRFIATTPLHALNGNTIQDLETWDDSDERVAQNIRKRLLAGKSVVHLGDDAQLLAGALLCLFDRPNSYETINKKLEETLNESYSSDPIWGSVGWHPMATGPIRYVPRRLRRR